MTEIMITKVIAAAWEVIKAALSYMAEDQYAAHRDRKEFAKFLEKVKTWCESFLLQNETTVLDSSFFWNYVKNYRMIEKIVDFVRSPNGQTEEEFRAQCFREAEDYLKESHLHLSPDDRRCLREFISGILTRTRDFYHGKVPEESIGLQYGIGQNYALLKEIQENMESQVSATGSRDAHMEKLAADIGKLRSVLCPTSPVAAKKNYPMPENRIVRRFAPFRELQEHFFLNLHAENMLKVCEKVRHIVLLGEAGYGKSIALEQLASMACSAGYYPLLYRLKDYTGGSIEGILEAGYPGMDWDACGDTCEPFLILDAYEEIVETDRKSFARRLNEYAGRHSDRIIVISSRNNFYSFSDVEGRGGLFREFGEYGLCPFTCQERDIYIEENGVDVKLFLEEVRKGGLTELISSPFYLRELLLIYQRNHCLPGKAEVMEEIIYNRFDKDCRKYDVTEDIRDNEYEIMSCLEKLAFAIQCLHTVKISNQDYQRLFDVHSRSLIQYSGIFLKDASQEWSFEHNNFREYLTARYMDGLGIEKLQEILFDERGKVFPSWMNVLSFLILRREKDDLLQLLLEHDPEMVVRFEKARVEAALRNEIVIRILDSFAEKNMWISFGQNSAEDIAVFGQSKELCEHLLKQIENPSHFRAQSNALSVLSGFFGLYGLEEKAQETLSACLRSEAVREYEKGKVLEALVSLGLDTEEISDYIVGTFRHDLPDHYRYSILEYLRLTDRYEAHFEIFLEEYRLMGESSTEFLRLRHVVMDVFAEIQGDQNLIGLLTAVAECKNSYSSDGKTYESIIANAVASYKKGNKRLYDTMLLMMRKANVYNGLLFEKGKAFFEQTGTKNAAFLEMAEADPALHDFWTIVRLERFGYGDEGCYLALLDKYVAQPSRYGEIVQILAGRCVDKAFPREQYRDALLVNGVAVPEQEPYFDYEKARLAGIQKYFDALFDKEAYCALAEGLAVDLGDRDITFAELEGKDYTVDYEDKVNYAEHYALEWLYFRLLEWKADDRKVLDTIRAIPDWPRYCMAGCYEILWNRNEVTVSKEQREAIESYCREQLEQIDFRKEIGDGEDGNVSYTYRVSLVLFFSVYFDFTYDRDRYLDMLFAPPCLLSTEHTDYGEGIPGYLAKYLTKEEIRTRVRHNLQEENLCCDALDMHIKYCQKNGLDWAVPAAEAICENASCESWRKQRAVNYLKESRGCDYVCGKYLDTEDEELLNCLIHLTLEGGEEHLHVRLRERMEALSRSGDEKKYLNVLLMLNSKWGLERYCEMVEAAGAPVEIPSLGGAYSTGEAIAGMEDSALLDILGKLRILRFTPGFADRESDGFRGSFYNCLYKAYQNIAAADFAAVKDHLEEALGRREISDEERSFCNTLLLEITDARSRKQDAPWTIGEIRRFFAAGETE